jgi:hypothetical protein
MKAILVLLSALLLTSTAVAAEPIEVQPRASINAPLDGEKIARDITTMRNNGLNNSAIKYTLGLDGINVPDVVLDGTKSVQDGISDGTVTKGAAPTTYSPPAMPSSPKPDLTPQGSSAPGWKPNVAMPSLDQLRNSINSRNRPPNC